MYAIRSTLRRGGAAPAAADVQPGAWVQWELRSEPGKLRRWDSVYWGGAEGFRNCSGPGFPQDISSRSPAFGFVTRGSGGSLKLNPFLTH